VEEVTTFVLQLGVTLGHDAALFLPICRPVLLPREVALAAFQAFAFVAEVERFNGGSIGVVGVLENPYVDTDALLRILRVRGRVVRCFDAENRVPLSSGFLFDRDSLDFGAVGQVAVEGERDFSKFREPQCCPTARVLELEAGLTVGETAVLARSLPVERPDAVAVLFASAEG